MDKFKKHNYRSKYKSHNNRNEWNDDRDNRPRRSGRPPAGLTGKAIGLYYRDLQKAKEKEKVIDFAIPESVIGKMRSLLHSIYDTEEGKQVKGFIRSTCNLESNININKFSNEKADTYKSLENNKNESDYGNNQSHSKSQNFDTDDQFKSAHNVNLPSTSNVDFIPSNLNKDNLSYRYLSIRGTSNYRFSYSDIITGTFEQKLDEQLRKGVPIVAKNEESNERNATFLSEYTEMLQKQQYIKMLKFRETLPTYKAANDLLDIIRDNQVIVISGETGCGKSTQVPQILLDDAICKNKGANTRIVVTQPRRIAASSLAARVAAERAECMGQSVGYIVRLEKIECRPQASITFQTTGVLLVELEENPSLGDISHIILDEVHERDSQVDLTMCMLKQIIKKRKDLKLIIMSATIDSERLSEYFNDCPMMHIEGLAYPVKDVFLEDILQMTKYVNKKPSKTPSQWVRPHMLRKKQALEMERTVQYRAEISPWIESIKHRLDRQVFHTLLDPIVEDLDLDLVVALIDYINRGEPGAILVFLPGISDISALIKSIGEQYGDHKSRFVIYPLHSKLPSLEQHRIFERPPNGLRKIIIATNIAETSITIDDIVYVIDCAKVKIKGLNVEDNVSTLKVEWVSKANLKQRRGRAGRCQPGICYHLLTSYRAEQLDNQVLPELQRSDLLEAVLTIKKLRLGRAEDAFKFTLDAPAPTTIVAAVSHLTQCGALDGSEVLTPLGWHLARLPVHPAAGKLLVLSALFGCLDRAACVAAVWGFKDPFMLVIGKESQVDEIKREFAQGEPSDQIAVSEAILGWERRRGDRGYAYRNFLSNNTLELLCEMKKQFGDNLRQMGFLPTGDIRAGWENRNSDNWSLFKAVVAAALYPNIGAVKWTNLHNRNPRKFPRIKLMLPRYGRVLLHPSSVMSVNRKLPQPLCSNPGANWCVYWLKQRSKELYIHDVTLVYTLPLLFFGELTINNVSDSSDCLINIASIKVRCAKKTMALLFELRSLLDHVLANIVSEKSEHSIKSNDFENLVLDAVISLITAEDEGTDYYSDEDLMSTSDND